MNAVDARQGGEQNLLLAIATKRQRINRFSVINRFIRRKFSANNQTAPLGFKGRGSMLEHWLPKPRVAFFCSIQKNI
jgi:hypothetical protein